MGEENEENEHDAASDKGREQGGWDMTRGGQEI